MEFQERYGDEPDLLSVLVDMKEILEKRICEIEPTQYLYMFGYLSALKYIDKEPAARTIALHFIEHRCWMSFDNFDLSAEPYAPLDYAGTTARNVIWNPKFPISGATA